MEIEKPYSQAQRELELIIGRDGILSQRMPGFEFREGQTRMAQKVLKTLFNDSIAAIEAGTGVGKTLAYLVPLILSGARGVVSTGGKTLQEQIFTKDIKQLEAALGIKIKSAMMKGRSNYVCLLRLKNNSQGLLDFGEDSFVGKMLDWARDTATGDRAELKEMPDNYSLWRQVAALPDACSGGNCPFFGKCFVTKRNREAAAADIIVVNHHLFFADLALREGDFGGARVLPDYQAVVFDEAHQVQDVATQYFGAQLTSGQAFFAVEELERLTRRGKLLGLLSDEAAGSDKPRLYQRRLAAFFEGVVPQRGARPGSDSRFKIIHERLGGDFERIYFSACATFGEMSQLAASIADKCESSIERGGVSDSLREDAEQVVNELQALSARSREMLSSVQAVFSPPEEEKDKYVFFGEVRARERRKNVTLGRSPIEVKEDLQKTLFACGKPLVFTSATLTAGGSFDYFFNQLGLSYEVDTMIAPSPFITSDNVTLYVPDKISEPNSETFKEEMIDQIRRLICAAGGGALVLFTSYANLNAATAALKGNCGGARILSQTDGNPARLLEEFREDEDSALLATGSFWEGVDVVGQSLRIVIIDKLPFAAPDDPLVEARIALMKKKGEDAFGSYQVPMATLALKQGLGRLIRGEKDFGVWAVLDKRLCDKGYGRTMLKSLYDVKITRSLDEASLWWQNIKSAK